MELEELVGLYVYNPKEELKQIIIKKSKNTSRISLITIIDKINKLIDENKDLKHNYNEIRKILLNEIRKEEEYSYRVDENGKMIKIDETENKKSSKMR